MPDLLRVRYLGDAPADVTLAGRRVDPDCVFDIPGKVIEEQEDCVVVDTAGGHRALPRSLFKVETPARSKREKAEE